MNFTATVFGEVGNVWREETEIANMIEVNPFAIHLRPVVGVGLHYLTPIGPLAFDLGINCNERPHEVPVARRLNARPYRRLGQSPPARVRV